MDRLVAEEGEVVVVGGDYTHCGFVAGGMGGAVVVVVVEGVEVVFLVLDLLVLVELVGVVVGYSHSLDELEIGEDAVVGCA